MTLLSISRPRAMSSAANRNEYGDFINGFARAVNRYAEDCKRVSQVNILEEAKRYQIQMAVPGYNKSDFAINIEKDILTISANVSENNNEINYLLSEFDKCPFERSFTLGKSVDTSKIEATYRDGILTITLQKREEAIEKPARVISVS
ncbi:MAG: Hsp20/alpha crystallin family protein [Tenuifilaceae bacterium]|jgi:HSP20 family protein|nr:Hsp20/alpha crystallin family protein [Tenuifilaceae bacterium]